MGKDELKIETDITDENELDEIYKIQDHIASGEKVLLVAKQSKFKPGGAIIAGGNTIYATSKKIIIRNPTMFGLRESVDTIPYDKITSVKLEKGMFSSTIIIRSPGLSELSRLSKSSGLIAWGRSEEGQIDAIPKAKAEQLVKIIKEKMEEKKNISQTSQDQNDDPIKILKIRYVKGEITKEEFEDMKQALGS
jgi:hypothetical protein